MKEANYPRFVYKSPGSNHCQGGTYDHKVVEDEDSHSAALLKGWLDSVPDALADAKSGSKKAPGSSSTETAADKPSDQDPDDDAPPTRAELEDQANKLGISFQPRISDKKLRERIELKMQGGD